ncbi:MAG: alkaline phosphatase family protein, partial [Nitrososphaeria archaeon]
LDPQKFLGVNTLHKILTNQGIENYIFIKKIYKDSGLSKILHTNGQVIPHLSLSDLYVQLRKMLENKKGEAAYFYMYWDSVDSLSHQYTAMSEENKAEVLNVFLMLKEEVINKLDPEVAKETLIIIVGDHGQSYVNKSNLVITNTHQRLLDMLDLPPTGETRVSYLYVKDSMEDDVIDYFERKFPDRFYIMRSKDALKRGFFGIGTPKEGLMDRIGDLIVLPKPGSGIIHLYEQRELEWERRGSHGGLTSDEMNVTLMISKFSELQKNSRRKTNSSSEMNY